MKLACLFSGGKDSNYALYLASKENEISCLISMISENSESYMFQTAGNEFIKFQAKSLNLPLIEYKTRGLKEEELKDLKDALIKAKKDFQIEGVVTGAIKSVYQASRIEDICNDLDLFCFNPLWQINEKYFLENLINENFKVIIVGIFSYPLTKNYLGKVLDTQLLNELLELEKRYKISAVGEGGEIETFVIDSPLFKKKINFCESNIIMSSENSAVLKINKLELKDK